MSLTPFSGTISATTLNSNFDDKTATLASNSLLGTKDFNVLIYVASLTSSTALSMRTVAWTQSDDQELRIIFGRGTDDGSNGLFAVTLAVDNGDATFLGDNTVDLRGSLSSGSGTYDTRTDSNVRGTSDYRTTSGKRIRLLKGVRYRLTISTNSGTYTNAEGCIQLRSIRRLS